MILAVVFMFRSMYMDVEWVLVESLQPSICFKTFLSLFDCFGIFAEYHMIIKA